MKKKSRTVIVCPNYGARAAFGSPTNPPLGALVVGQRWGAEAIVDAAAEDLSLEETAERIVDLAPDRVGISCTRAPLHNPTIALAHRLKELLPGVEIVTGGQQAVAMAELDPNLPAVYSEPIPFNDSELLPYGLLPMDCYIRYHILLSEGCPYHCRFCACHATWSSRVQRRDPSRIVNEIKVLRDRYGDRLVWFCDDLFAMYRPHAAALLEEIRNRLPALRWAVMTRPDSGIREFLDLMKQTGCQYVSYGIESVDRDILKAMQRRADPNEILETVRMTRKAGIEVYGCFLVGYPGETKGTLEAMAEWVGRSELTGAAYNILLPVPGSPLFDDLLSQGKIALRDLDWDRFFARMPDESHDIYSAELAARWCEVPAGDLLAFAETAPRQNDGT